MWPILVNRRTQSNERLYQEALLKGHLKYLQRRWKLASDEYEMASRNKIKLPACGRDKKSPARGLDKSRARHWPRSRRLCGWAMRICTAFDFQVREVLCYTVERESLRYIEFVFSVFVNQWYFLYIDEWWRSKGLNFGKGKMDYEKPNCAYSNVRSLDKVYWLVRRNN